jgi:DNA-binding transcriptional ArsR family regulator
MARLVPIAGYTEGLDPVLVPPVRLLIVATLADEQWCEYATMRQTLKLTPAALSKQLGVLRKTGHVESRPDGRRSSWRLTPTGAQRLTDHLDALQLVVATAAEIVASIRAGRRS